MVRSNRIFNLIVGGLFFSLLLVGCQTVDEVESQEEELLEEIEEGHTQEKRPQELNE